MRERVGKYRKEKINPWDDPSVGCIVLHRPFFFERDAWIPAPTTLAKNVVQGKTYDLAAEGARLWAAVQERLGALVPGAREDFPVYGRETLIKQRLGQGTFRVLITETYQRRCAVTDEKALPVLEAAHIRAVAAGGPHRIDNGLLLRSDIHTLYDRGYLTFTPDHRVRAAPHRLQRRRELPPPRRSRDLAPRRRAVRPNREYLEWHSDTVFKG